MKLEHTDVTVPPPFAHLESDCRGVASILARVGDKWSVFVIMMLSDGPRRFNEIKTIPPRVDYELTDLGHGLSKSVSALGKWAVEHQAQIEKARLNFDGRNDRS